jgi:hypothetical protein
MADVFESPALGPSVLVLDSDGVQRAVRPLALVDGAGNFLVPQSDATGQAILTALNTPVDSMPPRQLSATKRLARAVVSSSTATTTSLVAATALQTTRVYRAVISCAGACLVELLDGTTNAKTIRFPAAGVAILDFSEEPWVITTVNTALQFKTSAAVQVDVDVEYVKSA